MRPALHLALVAATLVLAIPGARAQTQDACTPDAMRLCRGAIGNVASTTACLVAHRAQLGATCRGVFAFAQPVVDRAPPMRTDAERVHPARPALHHARVARAARTYRRTRVARPYHIPRFDQAEAEAEVHAQYRYRTPYLPYWVFP